MNIKIDRLILQNFKGIRNLEINAEGKNLNIYGDNATGKTTVFDAFMWLLFGKDSLGRTDFGIKTQDSEGNTIHNLEHSVECVLNIDDAILTLKKVYAEKWTKKRGSAEAEFSGHETKYYINEVPSTKGEYTAKISGIIDEELFKTITNPLYFNEHLKWQERRAILLSICGNISDTDIIANSTEFSPLLDELKGRTVQEYKKIISNKQAGINDELKAIPQRISEATLAISATVGEVDENEKAVVEKNIADLNEQIISIKNGSGALKIETEIQSLREQKRQVENKKCDVSALENELNTYRNELSKLKFEISDCEMDIKRYFNLAETCEKDAEKLRAEWHQVNNEQYSESENCPTCGQPLPAEMIETAKAIFNTSRANRLEDITAKGKSTKSDMETYKTKHDECVKKLSALQEKEKEVVSKITLTHALISDATNNFADEMKVEIDRINSLIAEAENNRQNATESVEERINTINAQISVEKAKLAEIDKAIAERELVERQKKRIAELESDEKRLANEYSELDKIAFLIDKFTKHKVDLLSEEINSHFKYAKFKLFDEQINGGIAECCEVTYDGVPYSDLNNASRINIGLDIINTLCSVHGKQATIIVDNAESVVQLADTASQKICLYVSGNDKILRVEKG